MRVRAVGPFVLVFLIASVGTADWEAGVEAYNRQEFAAAAKEFEPYVKTKPQDPRYADVYNLLGQCYRHLQRFDEAEEHLRAAIELKPDNPEYRLALGQCLLDTGDFGAAEATFDAIKIESLGESLRVPAALLHAKSAQKAGNSERAIEILKLQLTENESSYNLHATIASIYLEIDDFMSAFGHLERAFLLDTSNVRAGEAAVSIAFKMVGTTIDESSRCFWYGKAFSVARMVATKEPSLENCLDAGNSAHGSDHFSEAVSWFEKASRLDSKDSTIYYRLGRSLSEDGQDEKALTALSKGLQLQPDNSFTRRIHRQIARVHAHNIRLSLAYEHFTLAGDTKSAATIKEIENSYDKVLKEKREYQEMLKALEASRAEFKRLNETKAIAAIDVEIAGIRANLSSIDANLKEVHEALRKM
jgi:tetratricopeptide (TPR) repeat protein